jgi:hypothetical protein
LYFCCWYLGVSLGHVLQTVLEWWPTQLWEQRIAESKIIELYSKELINQVGKQNDPQSKAKLGLHVNLGFKEVSNKKST